MRLLSEPACKLRLRALTMLEPQPWLHHSGCRRIRVQYVLMRTASVQN
jgi:hypothetical protein